MDTTIDNIDGGFFIQVQLFGDVGIEGDDWFFYKIIDTMF
jgi:hypothetical protein